MPVTVNVVGDEKNAEQGKAEFAKLLGVAASIGLAKDIIRNAIATENSKIGIHINLFKKADLLSEIKVYEGLLQTSLYAQASAIEKDSVCGYMTRISGLTSMQTVKVKVFTEDMKQDLVAKIARLKREADRVSDEINDSNSSKISVELDPAIAELIGL